MGIRKNMGRQGVVHIMVYLNLDEISLSPLVIQKLNPAFVHIKITRSSFKLICKNHALAGQFCTSASEALFSIMQVGSAKTYSVCRGASRRPFILSCVSKLSKWGSLIVPFNFELPKRITGL